MAFSWRPTGFGNSRGVQRPSLSASASTGELRELQRLEKEQGIEPDPEIDAFMKANAIEGKREGIETDYVLHVLGLTICADTLVRPEHNGRDTLQCSGITDTFERVLRSTQETNDARMCNGHLTRQHSVVGHPVTTMRLCLAPDV